MLLNFLKCLGCSPRAHSSVCSVPVTFQHVGVDWSLGQSSDLMDKGSAQALCAFKFEITL